MKIISNFKDYYDYLIAKYGVDERIVYNRKNTIVDVNEKGGCYSPFYSNKDEWIFHIAFCGTIYVIVKIGETSYYSEDFNLLPDDVKEFVLDYNKRYFRVLEWKHYARSKKEAHYQFIWNLKQTTFNETHNEPAILLSGSGKTPICSNIKLIDYGFQKVLSPEEVYLQIYNFISREKVIIDKRNDVEKLLSNGFDVKTSFRNIK
jgi:hypothetical protein